MAKSNILDAIKSMSSNNEGGDIIETLRSSGSTGDNNDWLEMTMEQLDISNNLLDAIELQTDFVVDGVAVLENIGAGFKDFFKQQGFNALNDTDPEDNKPVGPMSEPKENDAFSLGEFFSTLTASLVKFVTVLLPQILAAIGLSDLGFTGLEFKALDKIKEFFSKDYWQKKLTAFKSAFTNNKAIISIKEFFSGGKIQSTFDKILKPLKSFFSLEGEGTIAKIFKGFSKFGGMLKVFFGKILWPISVIMSAFDGFLNAKEDYKENESIVSAGFSFITGFLASFIGTFVDLIKDGIMWLVAKMFGIELDEEGNFNTEENPILAAIDSASFADGILSIGEKFSQFWNWITSSFSEWWDNFSFMDFISGDADPDSFKVGNGKVYGKPNVQSPSNTKREQLSETYADESSKRQSTGNVEFYRRVVILQ